MRTLTIKGRITLLYALLTALLPAVLLPVVYGAVSASLRREMDSQLRSAIAQVLIAVDDQDEAFRLNQQVDLPDAITLCVTDPQGSRSSPPPAGNSCKPPPSSRTARRCTKTRPTPCGRKPSK